MSQNLIHLGDGVWAGSFEALVDKWLETGWGRIVICSGGVKSVGDEQSHAGQKTDGNKPPTDVEMPRRIDDDQMGISLANRGNGAPGEVDLAVMNQDAADNREEKSEPAQLDGERVAGRASCCEVLGEGERERKNRRGKSGDLLRKIIDGIQAFLHRAHRCIDCLWGHGLSEQLATPNDPKLSDGGGLA